MTDFIRIDGHESGVVTDGSHVWMWNLRQGVERERPVAIFAHQVRSATIARSAAWGWLDVHYVESDVSAGGVVRIVVALSRLEELALVRDQFATRSSVPGGRSLPPPRAEDRLSMGGVVERPPWYREIMTRQRRRIADLQAEAERLERWVDEVSGL